MRNHLKMLAAAVAVALAEAAAYAYTPVRHDGTYTTNGVTYAQRGGLGSADYVVTNIDASAVGRVRSVNGMVGDVVIDAEGVGAVARDANYLAVSNAAMGAVQEEVDPSVPAWAKGETPPLPPDYAAVASNAAVAVKTETDPTVPAWAKSATQPPPPDYSNVSNKAFNAVQKTGDTMSGNLTIYSGIDGVAKGVRAEYSGAFDAFTEYRGDLIARGDKHEQYYYEYYFPHKTGTIALTSDIPSGQSITNAATWAAGNAYEDAVAAANAHTDASISETNDAFVAAVQAASPPVVLPQKWALANVTNASGGAVTAADVGAYPASDGQNLEGIVNAWEGYWGGTNVIFEVTNYYGNTSGEFPRMRVKELRDGAWNVVWDENTKFDVCETNLMSNVVNYVTGYAADNFAPRAWGTVTDKGSPNPVTNTVWMTSPETYFAGGTEYQRVAVGSGSICVLVDNGALTKTAGEPGTFRFQDDGGTNYFGFAKSESYTIGCRTDGIQIDGTLVTLRYDVIMAGTDVPIVYWRLSLMDGEWVQLNNSDGTATQGAPYTVTWYQSGGSYYAAINCGMNASGFFKAETEVAGEVVFETNMKIRAGGGIECQNTSNGKSGVIRPSYNGSAVTWTWSEN